MSSISKYLLYELSVQNPQWHVKHLPQFHHNLLGSSAVSLREDFCGSGKISCEWVKLSKKNRAVGLDIDPKPLRYANDINRALLTKAEQARVTFIKQNVIQPTREKFDLICACNFSSFALHKRAEMLQYAKSAYRSLKTSGTFFLDVAGGAGFLNARQKEKRIAVPRNGHFRQIWEQYDFNPITSVNEYAIHFMCPDGECLNDAFVYRWRIWQIRELREILEEAGFQKSVVLWEKDDSRGRGSGEFYITESAENAHVWVAYVVGVKSAKK